MPRSLRIERIENGWLVTWPDGSRKAFEDIFRTDVDGHWFSPAARRSLEHALIWATDDPGNPTRSLRIEHEPAEDTRARLARESRTAGDARRSEEIAAAVLKAIAEERTSCVAAVLAMLGPGHTFAAHLTVAACVHSILARPAIAPPAPVAQQGGAS